MIGKKVKEKFGSGITPTNNKRKDIMKTIKSLENRGILLKGTTRKITSQEGEFLNFLRPLMTTGLPLMKVLLIALTKCFNSIRINISRVSNRWSYLKESFWSSYNSINNFQ